MEVLCKQPMGYYPDSHVVPMSKPSESCGCSGHWFQVPKKISLRHCESMKLIILLRIQTPFGKTEVNILGEIFDRNPQPFSRNRPNGSIIICYNPIKIDTKCEIRIDTKVGL